MERSAERLEWIRRLNKHPPRQPKITIGRNADIHPTAYEALGGRGFTMERDDDGNWVRGQHLGDVIIGDRVHLAEFVVVNRATLEGDATVVGEDSKLAPFVLVGHNCKIGKHVFIGPHVCLHGSVEVGDNAWIAGHAVVHQHIKIGEGAIVGMGAVVIKDVPRGITVVGVPAVPIRGS